MWLEQMIRADTLPPTNNKIASKSSITRREQRYAEVALQAGIGDIETARWHYSDFEGSGTHRRENAVYFRSAAVPGDHRYVNVRIQHQELE